MIVVIDNYDSFVYNLVQFIGLFEKDIQVFRNDEISVDELVSLKPQGLVVSPGPCGPPEAGISKEAVFRLGRHVPVLGVCLGLQCIAEAFGGEIVRARRPMHGELSQVEHCGRFAFEGLVNPLSVVRYHSLVACRESLPEVLIPTAWSRQGEIMGLRHRDYEIEGLQFHPESVFTQDGLEIVRTFVGRVQASGARGLLGRKELSHDAAAKTLLEASGELPFSAG